MYKNKIIILITLDQRFKVLNPTNVITLMRLWGNQGSRKLLRYNNRFTQKLNSPKIFVHVTILRETNRNS